MVHPCRLGKFTLFVCSHLHSSLLRADVVEFYCLCERGVSTFVCFLREAAGKECWERRTPLLVILSGSRVGTYLVSSPPPRPPGQESKGPGTPGAAPCPRVREWREAGP